MTFDELKTTSFTEDGDGYYKFVVAVVGDGQGNKKTVVVAEPGMRFNHVEIRDRLQRASECKITCLGGGHLHVTDFAKYIRVEGRSSNIGKEPDRKQTIQLLMEASPGFRVEED